MAIELTEAPKEKNWLKMNYLALGISALGAFRIPTTDEEIEYLKGKVSKDPGYRKKIGFALLTAIKDGDFSVAGKPLSSTPGSEGYREDWKEQLAANKIAVMLVEDAVVTIFEGRYVSRPEENEIPFAKS